MSHHIRCMPTWSICVVASITWGTVLTVFAAGEAFAPSTHRDHHLHGHQGHHHHRHLAGDGDTDHVKCGAHAMRHQYVENTARHRRWTKQLRRAELADAAPQTLDPRKAGHTRKLAASTPWTMRIFVEYQIDNLNAVQTQLIKTLVNSAVKSLQKFIKIKRPVSGRLLVPRMCDGHLYQPDKCLETLIPNFQQPQGSKSYPLCGNALPNPDHFGTGYLCSSASSCTTFPAGKGEETDLYLYVTAGDDAGCDVEYLAYAVPCYFDSDGTGRPLLGSANICPSTLSNKTSSFDRQLGVIAHEIIHALGFEESMYEQFIDDSGNTLGKESVVGQVQHNGAAQDAIITPTVVQEARAYFNCPTLGGAPLEDEGGSGTAMSHWEWRVFQGDVMASILPQDGSTPQMGRMTLALLKDTGWYEPVFDDAGWVDWGRGAGCSFVEGTCYDYIVANPGQQYFCDTRPNEANTCTHTGNAPGTCASSNVSNGCSTLVAYSSLPGCIIPGLLDPMNLPFWKYGLNSRCYASINPVSKQSGGFINTWGKSDPSDAYCLLSQCVGGKLQMSLEGTWVDCPTGGSLQLTSVSSAYKSGGFQCPDNARYCSTLSCPGACSGNGQCRNSTCYCNIAYLGANCSERADGLPPFPPAPPGSVDAPPGQPVIRAPNMIGQIEKSGVYTKASNWISKNKTLFIIIAVSVGAFIVVLIAICCMRKYCCAPKLRGAQYAPSHPAAPAPARNPFAQPGAPSPYYSATSAYGATNGRPANGATQMVDYSGYGQNGRYSHR